MMVERFVFTGMQASDRRRTRPCDAAARGAAIAGCSSRDDCKDGRTIEEARAQIETIYARLRADYPEHQQERHRQRRAGVERALPPDARRLLQGRRRRPVRRRRPRAADRVRERRQPAAGARHGAAPRVCRPRRHRRVARPVDPAAACRKAWCWPSPAAPAGVLIAWWVTRALQGSDDHRRVPDPRQPSTSASTARCSTSRSRRRWSPRWSSASRRRGRRRSPSSSRRLKASAEGDERTRWSMRDVLVVGQLALSMVLLVIGALLGRGLQTAYATDLGYDPGPLSSLTFNLSMNGYDGPRTAAFRKRALEALKALPGVEGVVDRVATAAGAGHQHGRLQDPGPAYARTSRTCRSTRSGSASTISRVVGVPIVDGRAFTEDDVANEHGAWRSSTRPSRASTGRVSRRWDGGST